MNSFWKSDAHRSAIQQLIDLDPDSGKVVTSLSNMSENITTYDVYGLFEEYLNKKAKAVFDDKKRAFSLIHQRNEKPPHHLTVERYVLNDFKELLKSILKHKIAEYSDDSAVYIRVVDKVIAFGLVSSTEDINQSVITLSACVNALADMNAITAFLSKPVLIPLYAPEKDSHDVAITMYLAIHYKKQKTVYKKFKHVIFNEGERPRSI